jgi:hypothetical protein
LMSALYSTAFGSSASVWINMGFYFVQLGCVYHIPSSYSFMSTEFVLQIVKLREHLPFWSP